MATITTTARNMSAHTQAVSHQRSGMINAVRRKLSNCHLRIETIKSTCKPRTTSHDCYAGMTKASNYFKAHITLSCNIEIHLSTYIHEPQHQCHICLQHLKAFVLLVICFLTVEVTAVNADKSETRQYSIDIKATFSKEADKAIWSQVYCAVAEFTPLSCLTLSIQQTPRLRNGQL
ncbi:hypothetical protein BS50DRAFT_64886 [Corynespora cassiicola Philippines]|uniref:Uncharacterized protein n=1 Tax=Corynespora cassiicola Philippines TaxID=1448308 RepID=A0A2T2MZJ4_CORCC|nr:hypothetical protein BS50DRAFT_64886 [Corynespora cassiicola Philippines]